MKKNELITKYTDLAAAQKAIADSTKAILVKVMHVVNTAGRKLPADDINVVRAAKLKIQMNIANNLAVTYNDFLTDLLELKQ